MIGSLSVSEAEQALQVVYLYILTGTVYLYLKHRELPSERVLAVNSNFLKLIITCGEATQVNGPCLLSDNKVIFGLINVH